MFVKPKEGVRVRDPDSKRHLPAEGRDVPETVFWLRRLRDGDVVLVQNNTEHRAVFSADEAP